jgi:Transposase DDE domain group 1
MGRLETEVFTTWDIVAVLPDMPGRWIDRLHEAVPPKWITFDMDSSVSPPHGDQEGTAWNGYFGCYCYHPLFLFNQHGKLERSKLGPGSVHSADGWEDVLNPVMARYAKRIPCACSGLMLPLPFKAISLEEEDHFYAFRLPTNAVLQQRIAHLPKRPDLHSQPIESA